jgi:two-component system sensor histidine kinase DesK
MGIGMIDKLATSERVVERVIHPTSAMSSPTNVACTNGGEAIWTSRGYRHRLFWSGIWLFYLIYPIINLVQNHPPPLRLAAALVGSGLFIATYLWMMLWRIECLSLSAGICGGLVLLVALALAMIFSYGQGWFGLLIYAVAVAGLRLTPRVGVVTVLAIAALGGLVALARGEQLLATSELVLNISLIGVATLGFARLVVANAQLRAARAEIAHLAVAEERLRFARDLHDLLGHSLSIIALKSELAGRLLPAAPECAATEIHDVERVAREALREVRDAVTGYRQPTLTAELAGARAALEAAGVTCRCEASTGPLPCHVEAALAWVVREGATNVIRHSEARHCTIRAWREADIASVEVIDDGKGSRGTEATTKPGSGLIGLRERVAAIGGCLRFGPLSPTGFCLYASVPIKTAVTDLRTPDIQRFGPSAQ